MFIQLTTRDQSTPQKYFNIHHIVSFEKAPGSRGSVLFLSQSAALESKMVQVEESVDDICEMIQDASKLVIHRIETPVSVEEI